MRSSAESAASLGPACGAGRWGPGRADHEAPGGVTAETLEKLYLGGGCCAVFMGVGVFCLWWFFFRFPSGTQDFIFNTEL